MDGNVPLMDDGEIKERVESLAGKNARILDCEKKSSLVTEEVLLLNGQPVRLVGAAGEKIKAALKAGQPPPPEILSEVLMRAGIQNSPVQVETVMSVKSNTKTSEVSTLKDSRGQLVDEKMKEFEENDEFDSTNVEVWEKDEQNKIEGRIEEETNKMWDFYRDNMNGFKDHVPPGKMPKEMSFSTSTEESSKSRVSSRVNSGGKGGNQEVPNSNSNYANLPPSPKSFSRDYENVAVPHPHSNSNSNSTNNYPRSRDHIYENQNQNQNQNSSYYDGHENNHDYENLQRVPSPPPRTPPSPYRNSSQSQHTATRSPGRMPPLSVPANPKLRPPVPPKPAFIKTSLRTDRNLSLPVRVVYETFI